MRKDDMKIELAIVTSRRCNNAGLRPAKISYFRIFITSDSNLQQL